ncbi:hypothetical protein ACFY1L_46345 [Streptomyces sp. NPDC001663]|uniref:hypothetical protein n=1 Tax=Streptomyces sp. NPDC001663 TaxID=3364597 RepID=UPI0036A2A91E
MADYAGHAQRAQELLEQADRQTKRRYSESQLIAMAQVEALLALAAAMAGGSPPAAAIDATDEKLL